MASLSVAITADKALRAAFMVEHI